MTVRNKPSKHKHTKPGASADAPGSAVPQARAKTDQSESVADHESPEAGAPSQDALSETERLIADAQQWKDKFLRAKAEQRNAQRRAENETRESIRYANAALLRSLLDVMDDLDRTMEAANDGGHDDALVEGVRLIQGKVRKILADNGVTPIDAVGKAFDPNHQEALMRRPSTEHEPGTVIQQVQSGYMLRDRVLRPAKVIVSAPPVDNEKSHEGDDKSS